MLDVAAEIDAEPQECAHDRDATGHGHDQSLRPGIAQGHDGKCARQRAQSGDETGGHRPEAGHQADGEQVVHQHEARGADKAITDAIDASGVGDGTFVLGGQEVRVHEGEARLTSTESLAGSTLTMSEALRRAVRDSGLSVEQASRASSANPARVLGLEASLGSIAPGRRADLVVLDDDLHVTAVMAGGGWCNENFDR